jgi:MHS family proline/betaine transporter-like MFS transporter
MQINQIVKISLGNILQWLVLGLFLFLAPVIGDIFFPSNESELSKLAAFGVFAGSFFCRPIGGIVFGHFGDKFGRAKPIRFSILIITISTFFIGLLPSYASFGIIAPILLTLLCLIQGFAIGGAYNGVMIYLVESAPSKRRGFIGSFGATGANLGFLLAAFLILFLKHCFDNDTIENWAWRLPFVLIGLTGAFISYYFLKLIETPVFEKLKAQKKIEPQPLLKALRTEPKTLLIIFCINSMSNGFYYVFFGFMPDYLQNYASFSSESAFRAVLYMLLSLLIFVPIMGLIGDRFGRKNVLLITTSGMIVLALPMFYLLQLNSGFFIIIVLALATLLGSMAQGNALVMIVESSTGNIRYSSIAISYNLSVAVFGGLSPVIVMTLINKINLIAPGYYILLTGALGLIGVLLVPKRVSEKSNL